MGESMWSCTRCGNRSIPVSAMTKQRSEDRQSGTCMDCQRLMNVYKFERAVSAGQCWAMIKLLDRLRDHGNKASASQVIEAASASVLVYLDEKRARSADRAVAREARRKRARLEASRKARAKVRLKENEADAERARMIAAVNAEKARAAQISPAAKKWVSDYVVLQSRLGAGYCQQASAITRHNEIHPE